MKTFVRVAGFALPVILSALSAAALFAQDPPAPPPANPAPQTGKLWVDATEHDFGTVVEGEVVKHVFKLKSVGEGNLVITQAKPTCGCTIGRLSVRGSDGALALYKFGDPVAPSTELEMEAELNTKNKHSQASSKINIFCNDPRGTVTLGLAAVVDTYFRILPSTVEFGEVSVADTLTKGAEIAGKKPGPFLLSVDPKPLPQGLKVDLTPINPNAEGKSESWRLQVTLGPDPREGGMGYPLTLLSDQNVEGAQPGADGKQPRYAATVMVTGRIKGLISYEPQYLSFGLLRPGQVQSRTLKVQSFDPNFPSITPKLRLIGPNDATPEFKFKDAFTYMSRPSLDGKSVEIELTCNGLPESADGAFQGRLVIETGHPAKPEIPILFSGVCRPGPKPPGGQ